MKTNLLKKGKWWLLTAVLAVALMAVSLSFCMWDNLSIQALKVKTNIGGYSAVILNEHVILVHDNNNNRQADVGDIVTFGRYWQQKDATGYDQLEPIRWIVADTNANKIATLLSEKILVYGNFWGRNEEPHTYNQNYYQSTLRSWLNSGRDSVEGTGSNWTLGSVGNENLRNDGVGSVFNASATIQANKGFLDVAFKESELTIIVPKKITGIRGYGENNTPNIVQPFLTKNTNLNYINDLVWAPSFREIYGNIDFYGPMVLDDPNDKQFQYFSNDTDNAKKKSKPTAYSLDSTKTNYYNDGAGGHNYYNNEISYWRLRSPDPVRPNTSIVVYTAPHGDYSNTFGSIGGVRPAVCVQL